MLSSFYPSFLHFAKNSKFNLFLFLTALLISLSFSSSSSCTEQWSEISLDRKGWSSTGDVEFSSNSNESLVFEFSQTDTTSTDIGGAVWHSYDFSKKRGILISFKPSIKHDESYFGNVKYPQGFAIVFTSSSTHNLIGEKGSGLGYEGIMNSIAFEFDFVKQTTNGDAKKPHFSVNYNIEGAISASTKERTDNAYNIILPNFYDNSLDGYIKSIIFEIEIVGKSLTVRTNQEGYKTLLSTDLTEFQELLEQEDVHIGITASMNQNKKVIIEDFKVSEVSVNEKGELEMETSETNPKVKAGEEVALLYSIKSTCGEKLKIYPDEYSGNALKLIINNEEVKPESISFDEDNVQLKLIVTETKENIYTALIEFNGQYSTPTKFIVTSSDVNRLELCDSDEQNKYYMSSEIEQTKTYFYVPLCVFDQYGNRKQATMSDISDIKIGFPENIIPDTIIETSVDEENKKLIVKVPFTVFGEYKIFSEDFIESKIRYINFMPKYISPEKSELSILYEQNIVQNEESTIALKIKPKDDYGRDIPNVILEKMKCTFGSSQASLTDLTNMLDVTQEFKDDYVLLKVNKPEQSGRYIFTPKVKCDGMELTELKCGINSETKLNNCEFFKVAEQTNPGYINIFDEYLGEYVKYEASTKDNYLYISLDEKDNKKLTDVILLDISGSPYFYTSSNTLTVTLDNSNLEVIQIGNKYSLMLPSGKTRYNYSPVKTYELVIKLHSSYTFTINVKFYFLDQYMTNTEINPDSSSRKTYIAFYKQNSLILEAAETLLLFDIYEQIDTKYLGLGSSLDINKVSLYLGDKKVESVDMVNHGNYISVTSHELSKAGKYNIILNYDGDNIANINIEIIPNKEAYYLAKENGNILDNNEKIKIGKEEHIKLIMADKYQNLIQNNEIYNAFSKIKISKFDIFDIKLDYNGKIHIINKGSKDSSVTLTLINGNTYTIESSYEPKFEDLCSLNSYGLFTSSSIITTDDKVELSLYLRDKWGNIISSKIDKSVINIYIEGTNTKLIVPMSTESESSSSNGINYKASLEKNGDYEIKIFINNFPVECKACHFRRNFETTSETTKATLYILGNKQKIPVLNSVGNDNYNIGLIDKSTGYFSFYLEERDKYNNEYKETKSLAFSFESNDKSVDVTSITICSFGSNEDEKNYFKLCSGLSERWKNLPNGIYNLATLSESVIFKLYLTDSLTDSSDTTPVLKYSSILLNTNEIYGKTDMPGFFILDLRNKNYKRIENIDTSKITLSEETNTLKYEITKGPEKGLLTIILIATTPGEFKFNILYDNTKIISSEYTYYCACGFDKKLKYLNTDILPNGNYAFFKVLDSNNNECNLQYNFNDLSIKDFANNAFSAYESDKKYKIDTYYNHISNTFIFYFDNHVSDSLTLSSSIFKFGNDEETMSLSLVSNILDENHFYVKYETNSLTIKPLNANYEKALNYKFNLSDFDISLIRIVNDDFVIIKKNFNIREDLVIQADDSLIDAKGKYIYVVYYKGKELFCKNCIIDYNNDNFIDITKTRIYQKEGDDNYIQYESGSIMPMMKNNFPFFKINLFSNQDNLVILESIAQITISLETQTGDKFDYRTVINSNGNIYLHLTKTGRETYLNLSPMTIIKLKLEYSGKNYEASYLVFDYPKKKKSSIEYCAIGAIPTIINKQNSYIKRYDEELELEIYLKGCDTEHSEIKDKIKIINKETEDEYWATLTPTDLLGGYLLFLPKDMKVSEGNHYYIRNDKAESDLFELSIISGYEIGEETFVDDKDMTETNSDKLYSYFLIELKDNYGNTITNIGRNLFINDLDVITLDVDIPYKLTYDPNKKAFRCQVPINGIGSIKAQNSKASSFNVINIGASKFISNSFFELESEDSNKFTFISTLFDEFYKQISVLSYDYKISFKYFTINPLTEEVFIKDIDYQIESLKYVINLNSSFPKYSIYGFIPYIGHISQICPSCVKLNENPEYIYSIEKENYIPHNLDKNLFLIKNLDYPSYLYLAHKSSTISPTNAEYKELISTSKTKLYLISYKGSGDQINININSKTFSAKFIDYSSQTEIENRSIPPYVENYGFKVYTKNNLDNIHITFFMENRDNNGKLITTQPNLVIDNKYSSIIKRISVINTCYNGIYLVKITFSKSANIEFYPKFNNNHVNTDNSITIQLKTIGAFPTEIVLNNKEIINKNIVKYNLVTSNSNSEQVCDERLNIYIDDLNLKNFKKALAQEGEDCSLYIKFTGEATIKSNINSFISDINNNDRTLYNINPGFSTFTISPNVFDNSEESLSVLFKEKTPSGVTYGENEVNDNKNLYVYKYISPYKMILVKTYSGLFSSKYAFNSNLLNLKQGITYIIIGDLVDNNMPPAFIYYKVPSTSNTQEVKSIKANYFTEEKKLFNLNNFLNSKINSGENFELYLPLLLKVQLLDSSGNVINAKYNKDSDNSLKAELILSHGNDEYIKIDLIVTQYNDNTFYLKADLDTFSDLLHLPVSVSQDNYYYIHLTYGSYNFYSLLSLKENNLQCPHSQTRYSYSSEENIGEFTAKTYDNKDNIYISKDFLIVHQICLQINDNNGKAILNKHLDRSQLNLEIEGCSGFKYVNSYMGCFAFTTSDCNSGDLNINYNGKTSKLTINSFKSSEVKMEFNEGDNSKTKKYSDSTIDLLFNQNTKIELNKLFKVFMNGDRLEESDYSLSYNSNKMKISITKTEKLTNIPKIKNLMVIYDNGINVQKKLMTSEFSVTSEQIEYDSNANYYKIKIQEPFDLKVLNSIYFYFLLYENNACYFGDIDKLQNMKATIKLEDNTEIPGIIEREKVNGYSQCEYIYKVTFAETSKKSGNFEVNIIDNNIKSNTEIYIAPKDIDETTSSFSGSNSIQAGQKIYVTFSGTDSEGNSINYYDLIKEFDIQLMNSSSQIVDKSGNDYSYIIRVNKDNTAFNISLKITNRDTYTLLAFYKGTQLNLKSTFKINIQNGQCSITGANPTILPIDSRYDFYIGEKITIQIKCKDILGNIVEEEGSEIFTANIKQILEDNSEIKYDYSKTFSDGAHLISFTPSKIGSYSIDISLNGKKYGNTLEVKINSINKNKYSCMNKKQVDNIIDCDSDYQDSSIKEEDKYRYYVKSLLTESYMCYNSNKKGFIYKCLTSDEECVSNTINCGCLGEVEKYNGYCYSSKYHPINSVSKNPSKITCINKIKVKNPSAEVYQCPDGTCRFKQEECSTQFECPLGYRACGVKCILLSESCTIQANSCSSDQVLCWDLSCAKNYDSCPTRISCPKGKVLCPDGSCQLSGHCAQPTTRSCSNNQYQCPDFSCVNNKDDCKKNPVCDVGLSLCENGLCQESCQEVTQDENKFRCSNGKYVDNSKLCPSEIFVPSGYIKCPNGGIALSFNDCIFVQGGLEITCPNTKPILCPDLSCVSKSSECNTNYIPTCPAHKPYQCWNNECRKSFEECPTKVTCPLESPVLCQNGFCAKSSDECKEKSEDQCNKYRCFDGTCVNSIELCPTHIYCGKDQIKCWNGACVNNISECRSINIDSCPTNFPYKCPDGSCREKYKDCSTISVCPSNLPIKCFDNSCRASINECPSYQTCGENKVSCPDGTCALSFEECNTVITCPSSNPYLCYDNTCKYQLSDCPEPPKCAKNEVLCPNGACASSRQSCKTFDACETSYPIRCETNICTNKLDKCSSRKKRCPEGYVFCDNGECKTSEYLCEAFECPKNKPYKCKEGICVHDKNLCDIESNGCPYNQPFKCKDGTCVINENYCNNNNNFTCSNKEYQLCPDGSCLEKTEECPLKNGCYKDRPFKCADGTCINPSTTSCTPVLCPFDSPYKCPNGYCVKKSSDCSNDLFENELTDCGKENLIMCADGRCVESTEYCRPVFECENSYTKCQDGSCRVSPDLCPQNIQCPKSRPVSCNNMCVKSSEECSGLICPEGYTKCPNDGLCKASEEECKKELNTDNICSFVNKKMCKNGRCVNSKFDCSLVSEACPDEDKPYLCPNGECINDISKCSNIQNFENICEEGKVLCNSGRCVENKKEILISQCTNNIGCPLDKPYRCSNGDCVQSERKCEVTSILEEDKLRSNIICDPSKPYLCSDKTCVSDTSFCKVAMDCPTGKTKCDNGYCINEGESCTKFSGYCPSANPIHCPSGTCVDDISKCTTSFNIPSCGEGEFYCARLNKCLKNKLDCLIYLENVLEKQEINNNIVRLLNEDIENIVNPLNDEEFIKFHKNKNKIISLAEETDNPDKDIISLSGTICFDGTIASNGEKCPIVPACKIGQYRCENGACASDLSLCPVEENYICLPGQKKCPDGLCHKDCSEVAFHGCEVNKYQCSNGQCLEDKYDCIGHSMCPDPAFPFRCITGECKSDPEDCEVIERLGSVKNLTYSFNKLNKIEFNFAFDYNGHKIGSIEIPSNGLNLEGNYSNIVLEEVSSSMLYDNELYNNSAEFLFNVSNSISGSDGVLNFENSVMSPVFKFYPKNNDITFKFPGKIKIDHNEYESSAFYYYDYCLAKLKGFDFKTDKIINSGDKGWECVERQEKEGQNEFKITEFGVYAVILNPSREKVNYIGFSTVKNFFFENVKIILIVFAIIIVLIALIFYIFIRVTRYRKKYHDNREKILLAKQQREEYENMTTDIFGQTLGDNINGIVYKVNPAYTVTEEIKKAGTSLEDEIEKLQLECKNVSEQNERLQKDIDEITKKYEELSKSIEDMNK